MSNRSHARAGVARAVDKCGSPRLHLRCIRCGDFMSMETPEPVEQQRFKWRRCPAGVFWVHRNLQTRRQDAGATNAGQ